MKRLLARGLAALVRDRGSSSPRPDFGPGRLFAQLDSARDRCGGTEFDAALSAYRRGHTEAAFEWAVAHFASPARPRFFVDSAHVLSTAEEGLIARVRAACATYARDTTTSGLAVYAMTAPPLRPGFPWGDPVGGRSSDMLFAVHPHRFAFLPPLALAAATGGLATTAITAILDDWMLYAQRAPRLPWLSNLVVTQRLLACTWSFALAGTTGNDPAIRARLLRILAQDVTFLIPRLGDSAPNNHLLIDRFVEWFVALLLPELTPRAIDVARAEAAWLAELERQTYADGGSFEHSTHYHRLACEAAAGYLLLSDANDRPVPEPARQRIGRMLYLQSRLCGADGSAPAIGDSSDDPLFALDGRSDSNAGALREIHRALFDASLEALDHTHPGRLRAWWLLGGRLAPAEPVRTGALATTFRSAGFAILEDASTRTRWIVRIGVIAGTRYHPGHQHADALSVTLVCDGIPMIVDAGTYTYRFARQRNGAKAIDWRQHFAGPGAHNGPNVEEVPMYPPLSGDFRPTGSLPEVRIDCADSGSHLAAVEATLEGRSGHPGWTRGVIGLRGAMTIVYDLVTRLPLPSRASVAIQWTPGCALSASGQRMLRARAGATDICLAWSDGLGPEDIVAGGEQPVAGWVSPRYGERLAAPRLALALAGSQALTAMVATRANPAVPVSVNCKQSASDVRIFRVESEAGTDIVWLNRGATGVPIEADGVTFDGRLAWIRIRRGSVPIVRWLGGRTLAIPAESIERNLGDSVAEHCD